MDGKEDRPLRELTRPSVAELGHRPAVGLLDAGRAGAP